MEIFVHEVMEVSKRNVGFLHFEVEASFEDTFTLGSFEGVDLKEQFQDKVLIDKRLSIFDLFLALEDVLYLLYDVVLIRSKLFGNNLQSLAEFDIGNGIDCSKYIA